MPQADVRIAADAVVAGGGPAGIATALVLVEAGLDVVVVERTRYDAPRIGETLAPVVRTSLARLRLADRLPAELSRPCFGIRNLWGRGEPLDRSFLFDPYGCGWHVDRRALDESLAAAAEKRGARVLRGQRLVAAARAPGRGWELRLQEGGRTSRVSSRLVVDATGRAAAFARRMGSRRIAVDRAVAIFGFYRAAATVEPVAVIEAVVGGWWYSAPLPGGRLVAALVTDTDLLRNGAVRWDDELRSAPHTRERIGSQSCDGSLRTVSATCSRLDAAWGDGWVAVGDAALAGDPLAGDGVHRALQAGLQAGEAILAAGRRLSVGADYRRELLAAFDVHRRRRAAYYARETRWPDAPFWRRRTGPEGA